MPSKPKIKLKKGKAVMLSPRKQPPKAARRAQACTAQQEPDLVVIEEQFMANEALTEPLLGMAFRLDTMMAMILELSQKVNGQTEAVYQQEDTPSTSLSIPQVKRRRASCPDSLTQDFSIDQRLQKSLRQAPLVVDSTSDKNSSSEEGPITHRKRRMLKSGMEHMGATLVKKRINWPPEGVFTADGKPAVYSNLTLTAFVRGYLMVFSIEMDMRVKALISQHLEELMENTDLSDGSG